MPWDERIVYRSPLPAGGMDVRVANTSELNLNENIMRLKLSALYRGQFERTFWTESSACININHNITSCNL
ncbi:hypothetical protein D3C85_1766570 [compost metagenome]